MHSVVLSSLANKCKVDPARYMQQCSGDVVKTYSITISQDVSIQVQFVRYQTHPGLIHTATILGLINATIQGAILLAFNVNTDTSQQLINVSTRTRSTRLQSCD